MTLVNNDTAVQKFKLPKSEKLCSQIQIEYLFANSRSIFEFPIKFNCCIIDQTNRYWNDKDGKENPSVINIFATSKKYFKRAVKRNRCKRILRECYRLNNHDLKQVLTSKNRKVIASWSYVSKKEPDYLEIEKAMLTIFKKCIAHVSNA